jgi:flagellar basal-body rod modification protein FlgD
MVGSVGSIGVSGLERTAGASRAAIARKDFLKILTAELTNQDPLSPMDNTAFLQQLVALEQVQTSAAMTDALKAFEGFLQLAAAGGMIGLFAKGIAEDGSPVSGMVTKVLVEGGRVFVMLGATKLPFANLTEMSAAAQ